MRQTQICAKIKNIYDTSAITKDKQTMFIEPYSMEGTGDVLIEPKRRPNIISCVPEL
jgi:hypothetical protein